MFTPLFTAHCLQGVPEAGDAPIKVQHFSGREIGVNIKYLDNPFGIKYKLNGFELGGCHPFQIRRVYILFQKGWRDIDVALRQPFLIRCTFIGGGSSGWRRPHTSAGHVNGDPVGAGR